MNNRSIKYIGYSIAGMHAIAALVGFFALLGSPDGASVVIALIAQVPFVLLLLAGVWLIGRIRWLPFAYLMVASVALCGIDWLLISGAAVWGVAIHVIGTIASIGSAIVSVITLWLPVGFPARKKLVIAGMIGLALLCVAAVVFFTGVYLIVLPGGASSPIPSACRWQTVLRQM